MACDPASDTTEPEPEPEPGSDTTVSSPSVSTNLQSSPTSTQEGVACGVRRDVGACMERARIVGGGTAGCNEWPWQVGLLARQGFSISSDPFCGGTLINSRYVVTAAHCTDGKTAGDIAVSIGDHNISATAMEPAQTWAGLEALVQHPGYNEDTTKDDISVLRLAQEVDMSLFSPACLPAPSVASSQQWAGQNATATGWGALQYGTGDYPEVLQELQDLLPIVTNSECVDNELIDEGQLLPGMFCAGGPGLGIDTCQGDSGGPLTRQAIAGIYELIGVVSWGVDCAKSYGVYADIPYYHSWLAPIVGSIYHAPATA